jgi:hypothetical protein
MPGSMRVRCMLTWPSCSSSRHTGARSTWSCTLPIDCSSACTAVAALQPRTWHAHRFGDPESTPNDIEGDHSVAAVAFPQPIALESELGQPCLRTTRKRGAKGLGSNSKMTWQSLCWCRSTGIAYGNCMPSILVHSMYTVDILLLLRTSISCGYR